MARESVNESTGEKTSRWYRNFNGAVGAVALGATILVPSALLTAYGAFNLAQAGGGEVARRHFKKKRQTKKS